MLAAYPALAGKPVEHVWHPAYPGEALSPEARADARAGLGWGGAERVYGYCGQLRPYKGVEDLIAAFRQLPDPAARLLVAGRPRDAAFAGALRALAGGDARIRLVLEDLTPDRFRACLGACDIVAAPFRRYLHSGSIVHALSAQRPVLTPATPFATSLAAELGRPDWLQTYQGPLTPATLAGAQMPGRPSTSARWRRSAPPGASRGSSKASSATLPRSRGPDTNRPPLVFRGAGGLIARGSLPGLTSGSRSWGRTRSSRRRPPARSWVGAAEDHVAEALVGADRLAPA